MARQIRVLVVDDSALVRTLLKEIIDRQTDMVCVGVAVDPFAARESIRELNPDVLTLDVEMPRMDGLEFLSRLMRLRPTPVVMVSALTERGAEVTFKALELGAVDFVDKPKLGLSEGLRHLADEITEKIRTAAKVRMKRSPELAPSGDAPTPAPAPAPSTQPASLGRVAAEKVIFIGASTGGTEAIKQVLMHLPADVPPLLITQHMPGGFTRSYAARLDALCPMKVQEAVDGERVQAGQAYLAPGGFHLTIERKGAGYVTRVHNSEPVNRHRPSVDVLFESAARVVGPHALGVMLTGMGNDGARAMRAMRDAGAFNLVQDETTSVVFGMPKEAIAAGAASEVLPLHAIAPRLLEKLRHCTTTPLTEKV